MTQRPTDRDVFAFPALMFGQIISILGSAMTSFVLSIVSFEKRGSIAELSSVILAFSLPGVLAAPFAGALLDRFDRRAVLAFSSLCAALSTLGIAAALSHGPVALWQILLCVGGISLFGSTQVPAITAMTAALVSKENYAKVNGVWQLAGGLVLMVAPLLAGLLLQHFGVRTIIACDFCSYLVAVATLALVRLGGHDAAEIGEKPSVFSLRTLRGGWTYIWARPGLRQLLAYMAVIHLVLDMIQILLVPIALGHGEARTLASVMAVSSLGMILGGTAMAISGGTRHRITGLLVATMVFGLGLCLAGQASHWLLLTGMFITSVAVPFSLGSNEAIWQVKTESAYQGRVFALEAMVAQAAQPVACLLAPFFCDLAGKTQTARSAFGHVSSAQSAGVVLVGCGVVVLAATLVSFSSRRLRSVEAELPDATPASLGIVGAVADS